MWESRSKNHMEIFLHISLLFTFIFSPTNLFEGYCWLQVFCCCESHCVDHLPASRTSLGKWHMQSGNKICLKGKTNSPFLFPAKQAEVVMISLWQSYLIKNTYPFFHCLIIKKYSIGLLPSRNSSKKIGLVIDCSCITSCYNYLLSPC